MSEKKITAVIIDDMELARKSLAADIEEYCHDIDIIGEAHSVITAAKLLKNTHPDIIFLDIHLQDGDGFDLLELLPDLNSSIIFTTASDAHAIKAFQFSAADYLLKPIDPDLLQQSVEKVSNQKNKHGHLDTLSDNMKSPSKLVLHTAEQVKIAELADIIRLESMGNYTYFFFTGGEKLLITKTLKEYHDVLKGSDFLRVHQSHLINLSHLKAYIKTEGGYLEMTDGSRVPVSVRKKSTVMDAIVAYGNK